MHTDIYQRKLFVYYFYLLPKAAACACQVHFAPILPFYSLSYHITHKAMHLKLHPTLVKRKSAPSALLFTNTPCLTYLQPTLAQCHTSR